MKARLQVGNDEVATKRPAQIDAIVGMVFAGIQRADLLPDLQDLVACLRALDPQAHGAQEIEPIDTAMPVALATESGEGSRGAGQVHVHRLAGTDIDVAQVAVRHAHQGLTVDGGRTSRVIAVNQAIAIVVEPVVADFDASAGPGRHGQVDLALFSGGRSFEDEEMLARSEGPPTRLHARPARQVVAVLGDAAAVAGISRLRHVVHLVGVNPGKLGDVENDANGVLDSETDHDVLAR